MSFQVEANCERSLLDLIETHSADWIGIVHRANLLFFFVARVYVEITAALLFHRKI